MEVLPIGELQTEMSEPLSENKSLAGNCQSCLMPFKKDKLGAQRHHENYCSYCFFDGKLAYEGNDRAEFKREMVAAIVARGESKMKAKILALMAGFAPRWKK